MRNSLWSVPLVLVATLSCGGDETPSPSGSAGGAGIDAAAEASAPVYEITFFVGTSEYELPSGAKVPGPSTLVARTVDETTSRILEDVANIDADPAKPAERYVVTFTVTGADFTMTASQTAPAPEEGIFSGQGTLTGTPWAWTSWTSHTDFADGSTLDSVDALSELGLVVEKRFYDADGALVVIIREDLPRVDEASYNAAIEAEFVAQ